MDNKEIEASTISIQNGDTIIYYEDIAQLKLTKNGIYISKDDGTHWTLFEDWIFQKNLDYLERVVPNKDKSSTEDVAPVVHAKWSDEREYCHNFMCSNCGKLNNNNFDEYCKHCGAKMDKE